MRKENKEFKIEEVTTLNKEKFDSFLVPSSGEGGSEILQSYLWGNICISDGANIKRFFIKKDNEVLAVLTGVEKKVFRFFSYIYLPRGPIFLNRISDKEKLNILEFIGEKFKFESYLFLRFEPENFSFLKDLKNIKKSISIQPKKTLLLDLKKDEESLLKEMHQKTRYNIRLAQKKNLVFEESCDFSDAKNFSKDFSDFWRLMNKTSKRDEFGIHSESHYRNLIENGGEVLRLFFISFEGEKIAAGIFSFFGNKCTYLHGASDDEYRNLMAPYLLQFEVIKMAKNKGFKLYDFYGIDEIKWPGVTRFKKGFGGFEYSYAGTLDLILCPFLYNFYKILRRLRRFIS